MKRRRRFWAAMTRKKKGGEGLERKTFSLTSWLTAASRQVLAYCSLQRLAPSLSRTLLPSLCRG